MPSMQDVAGHQQRSLEAAFNGSGCSISLLKPWNFPAAQRRKLMIENWNR